jgi:hypothetical protein
MDATLVPLDLMYKIPPVSTNAKLVKVPSALVAMAVAMLLYSVSSSVPLTILDGLPDASASLAAKLVDFE